MQRALLSAWMVLALCVSVSIAQNTSDKSDSDKNQLNTEQVDKKKSDADKAKAERDAAKAKIEAVKAKIKARLKAEEGKIEATAAEIEAAVKAEETKNGKDEKASAEKRATPQAILKLPTTTKMKKKQPRQRKPS